MLGLNPSHRQLLFIVLNRRKYGKCDWECQICFEKMLQYLPAEWNSPPPSVSPSQRFPKTKLNNSQVVAEILHVLQPLVHLVTIRINRFGNFHEGPHWCINFSWDKTKAKIDA